MSSPDFPLSVSENAVHRLAADIHADTMHEIESGLAPDIANQTQRYPAILFGELALHITGTTLPKNTPRPERARAIADALQRIHANPTLLELITDAPHTDGLHAINAEPRVTDTFAKNLQTLVAKRGYIERDDFTEQRSLRLEYATTKAMKTKRFRGEDIPEGTPIQLLLSPVTRSWKIALYDKWDSYNGFSGRLKEHRTPSIEVMQLIAVHSPEDVPKQLQEIVGHTIGIGQLGKGTKFTIGHTHRQYMEEVKGHPRGVTVSGMELPATLRQAYIGDSYDYPLFRP